jgi:hypothetical protein
MHFVDTASRIDSMFQNSLRDNTIDGTVIDRQVVPITDQLCHWTEGNVGIEELQSLIVAESLEAHSEDTSSQYQYFRLFSAMPGLNKEVSQPGIVGRCGAIGLQGRCHIKYKLAQPCALTKEGLLTLEKIGWREKAIVFVQENRDTLYRRMVQVATRTVQSWLGRASLPIVKRAEADRTTEQ